MRLGYVAGSVSVNDTSGFVPGSCDMQRHQVSFIQVLVCMYSSTLFTVTGASIPVDGGGLLTSWFNTDLQPRIADNGEDVIFGHDHASKDTDDGTKT